MAKKPSRSKQETLIKEFKSITNASDKQARDCLSKSEWRMEAACNHWFTSGMVPEGVRVNESKIRKDFDALVKEEHEQDGVEDGDTESFGLTGVMNLCEQLDIDPMNDWMILAILHYMQAPGIESVSWSQFKAGYTALAVSTTAELKAKIGDLRRTISRDKSTFRSVYRYAYKASCTEGRNVLDLEVAIGLMRLLLEGQFTMLDQFIAFLEEKGKEGPGQLKVIGRDAWNQLLAFSSTVTDLERDYDEDAAWPVLIDDFVEWMQQGGAAAAAGGGGR